MTASSLRLYAQSAQPLSPQPLKEGIVFYVLDTQGLSTTDLAMTYIELQALQAVPLTLSLALCTVSGQTAIALDGALHISLYQVVQELMALSHRRIGYLRCFVLSRKTLEHVLWKALRVSLVSCKYLPPELRGQLCEETLCVTSVPRRTPQTLKVGLVCMVSDRFLAQHHDELVGRCGFGEVLDLSAQIDFLEQALQATPGLVFTDVLGELMLSFEEHYPDQQYRSHSVASYIWDSAQYRIRYRQETPATFS